MVGVTGLEPATSAFRTPRASHLRYTPFLISNASELGPDPIIYFKSITYKLFGESGLKLVLITNLLPSGQG